MTRSVRLGLLLWGAIGVGALGAACGSSSPRDKNFGTDAGSDFEAPVREVGTGSDGAGGEAGGGGTAGGGAAGSSGSGGDSTGGAGTGAAAGSGGAAGGGASGNGGAAGASA